MIKKKKKLKKNINGDNVLFFKEVLAKSLRDKEFCLKVMQSRLKPDHFPRSYMKWAFKLLKTYMDNPKYGGKLPGLKVLQDKLEKDANIKKILKVPYFQQIKKLYSCELQNEEYSLEVIEDHIRNKEFKIILEDSLTKMGKYKDTNIVIQKLLNQSFRISNQATFKIVDYFDNFRRRQKERELRAKNPKRYKRLKFNVPTLDDCLPGGLVAPMMLSIAAKTGIGKSVMTIHLDVEGAKQGFNVTHVTSENELDQTEGRLDSYWTDYKYDDIQLDRLDKDAKKKFVETFETIKKTCKNKIKILKFKPNEFNASTILQAMNILESEGHKTDLLIVDSPDLMQSVANFKEERLKHKAIYWELKEVLTEKNCIGIVTTQLSKASNDDNPTAEDLSEAYDKARLLDFLFVLTRNKTQKINGEASLVVVKNRDGKLPREAARIAIYFERMKFKELPPEDDDEEGPKKKKKPNLKLIKGGNNDQLNKLRTIGKKKNKSKLKGVHMVKREKKLNKKIIIKKKDKE